MTSEQKAIIIKFHSELPSECRSEPASLDAIVKFEYAYGVIPEQYRWYLQECGGGVVGCEWVDDIKKLEKSYLKFMKEEGDLISSFIFGWDGSGNPLLIDRSSGKVFTHDHNFGGTHTIAESFVLFYLNKIRKIKI